MLTQHYLSFLVNKIVFFLRGGRDYRFTALQLLSLTKWFFIQISIIHDNISSQKGRVLAYGWTCPSSMAVFVNLFIRKVIQKVTIVTSNTVWHCIPYLVWCVVMVIGRKCHLTIFVGRNTRSGRGKGLLGVERVISRRLLGRLLLIINVTSEFSLYTDVNRSLYFYALVMFSQASFHPSQ